MSQEAVPQQGASALPKGLLQQTEELMAAPNADLSDLLIKTGFLPMESKADQPRSEPPHTCTADAERARQPGMETQADGP